MYKRREDDMTDMNGQNIHNTTTTGGGVVGVGQTPSKSSTGGGGGIVGGLLKRFSPKYSRSRSKSPATASRTHQNQQTGGANHHEKSWVTVEIKDFNDDDASTKVGAAGGKIRNYEPPVAGTCSSSSISSPSSPTTILRNGGNKSSPSSSASPARIRGAFGNLFHRSSMKHHHKQKSGGKNMILEPSSRTRSEHELAGNTISGGADFADFGGGGGKRTMIGAISTEMAGKYIDIDHHHNGGDHHDWASVAQRSLARQNGGDIREGSAARGALSEEDLVSKSLLSRQRGGFGGGGGGCGVLKSESGAMMVPPLALSAPATYYHSQDSVFLDSSTPSSSCRVPSYVRISCTLSGYRNYRSVDLKSAASSPTRIRTPPMISVAPAPAKMEINGNGGKDDELLVEAAPPPLEPTPTPDPTPPQQSATPLGKSIVERRLEKFEKQQVLPPTKTPPQHHLMTMTTTEDGSSVSATPTPIRNLISNFNKMTLHDVAAESSTPIRPRQKAPPAPPEKKHLVVQGEGEGEANLLDHRQDRPPKMVLLQNGNHHHQDMENEEITTTTTTTIDTEFYQQNQAGGEEEHSSFTHYQQNHHQKHQESVGASFLQQPQQQSSSANDDESNKLPYMVVKGMTKAEDDEAAASSTVVGESISGGEQLVLLQEDTPAAVEAAEGQDDKEKKKKELVVVHEVDAEHHKQDDDDDKEEAVDVVSLKMSSDGFYYKREAAEQRTRLEALCVQAETDLNRSTDGDHLPDEAAEALRMAIGRVRLLLGKKFKKFEELIDNNLHPKLDDPRRTYVSDLEGYYDLVKMEIEDIDSCFDIVHRLRQNNWQPLPAPTNKNGDDSGNKMEPNKRPPPPPPPKSSTTNSHNNTKKSAGDQKQKQQQSEAAKQRLKEAKAAALKRKKELEEQQQQQNLQPSSAAAFVIDHCE